MLLMLEKGKTSRICHSIYSMKKLTTNIWKIMIKIKNLQYLQYWDEKSLYGWVMLQKVAKITLSGSKILLNLMKVS